MATRLNTDTVRLILAMIGFMLLSAIVLILFGCAPLRASDISQMIAATAEYRYQYGGEAEFSAVLKSNSPYVGAQEATITYKSRSK